MPNFNLVSICLLDYCEVVAETSPFHPYAFYPLPQPRFGEGGEPSHHLFANFLSWRAQVEPSLPGFSQLQKRGGGRWEKRSYCWGGGKGKSKVLKFDLFINVLSPSLDLSQSFSLGRSYPNLSDLGSPFSDPMKSGAAGEGELAVIVQTIPAAE